jgi:hypothetical protein
VREAALERSCCALARARGVWAVKILPSIAGLPDRLLLAPGGIVQFIEFKTLTGRVSPIQKRVFGLLGALGFPVEVVRTRERFKALLDRVTGKA